MDSVLLITFINLNYGRDIQAINNKNGEI